MKAVLLLGNVSQSALDEGAHLARADSEFLDRATTRAGIDADVAFVVSDPKLLGVPSSKLKIDDIRRERARVLAEIAAAAPDVVLAFGPTPVKCLLDKGSSPPIADMRRREHRMPGVAAPVHVLPSLEEVAFKPGMRRWVEIDLTSIGLGLATSEVPDYPVLLPGTPEWDVVPDELRWYLVDSAQYAGQVPRVGLDLETYPAFDPWHPAARIRMAQVSHATGAAWVVQATPDSQLPAWLVRIIEYRGVRKVGSNPKFDHRWLRRFGYKPRNWADTSTAEHVINENSPSNGLKVLTLIYHPSLGDYSADIQKLIDERGDMEHLTDAEMYKYAGADADASVTVYDKQIQILEKVNLRRPYEMTMELYNVLGEMEFDGACVSMEENARLDAAYVEAIAGLRGQLTAAFGAINPNSQPQLMEALKRVVPDINLVVRKRNFGAVDDEESTEARILRREAKKHPIIDVLLDYRRLDRLHKYVTGIQKHARQHGDRWFLHTTFKTDRVETYRLSSVDPNNHNIPRNLPPRMRHLNIKDQFVSRFPGGVVFEVDMSQVELRFGGIHSRDPVVRAMFASGLDIHSQTAALMYGIPLDQVTEDVRQAGKTVGFRIYYGGGPGNLARELGITYRAAQGLIDSYFRQFAGVKGWMDGQRERAIRDLHVTSLYGFERRFHEPRDWQSPEGWHILRQAVNAPIQCDAFQTTGRGLVLAHRELRKLGMRTVLALTVHDSVVADAPPEEFEDARAIVTGCFENPDAERWGVDLTIPMVAGCKSGPSWGAAK